MEPPKKQKSWRRLIKRVYSARSFITRALVFSIALIVIAAVAVMHLEQSIPSVQFQLLLLALAAVLAWFPSRK